jgi:flavin reductase
VNFLAERDQDLAIRFSGVETRDQRFGEGNWAVLTTGSPILETALASFDCAVTSVIDGRSHSIFIAEVVASRCGVDEAPLLYFTGGYGGFVATEPPVSGR